MSVINDEAWAFVWVKSDITKRMVSWKKKKRRQKYIKKINVYDDDKQNRKKSN